MYNLNKLLCNFAPKLKNEDKKDLFNQDKHMNRIVYLVVSIVSIAMFTACSNGDELLTRTVTPLEVNTPNVSTTDLPATKVFVQGAHLSGVDTRSDGATTRAYSYGDLTWPSVNIAEGWEVARFTIRIDGTLPGWLNQDAAKYWGGHEGPNLGKVWTGYAYGTYDDRGLDYYKKDTKTGNNIGMFRYVYDESGIATQSAIKEAPDVATFLTYWLNKEKSETTANYKALKAAIDGLNNNETKVLWYVVKEVGMQYGWHVNGVLTNNDVENVNDVEDPDVTEEVNAEVEAGNLVDTDPLAVVPNNVEVDIHLQEHKDWNEIKTSAHIRSHSGTVTINLPLTESNIIEQDDFNIRVYDYYYKEYENVKTKITHDNKGVTIEISGIQDDMIDELKANFGDGLTVEVHSYCKQIEGVWEELKKSKVVTEKTSDVKGQITTAYSGDKVIIGD